MSGKGISFLMVIAVLLLAIFFGSRRPILLRAPALTSVNEPEIPLNAVSDQNQKRLSQVNEDPAPQQGELIIEKSDPETGNSLVIEPIPREPSSTPTKK